MKQIRQHVFETNSSSVHSVTVYDNGFQYDNVLKYHIQDDRYLHVEFNSFGWEEEDYFDAYSKLQYLLTFIAEKFPYEEVDIWCCGHPMDMDAIYDLFKTREDFNKLNDLIKEELHNCNGIWLDESEGCIDHQSHECYETIDDLLHDHRVESLYDFIFNSNVVLHTDNDNHY